MNRMLVVHDSPYARCLAQHLWSCKCLDKIIVETGRPPLKYYRRKLREQGLINMIFAYLYNQHFTKTGWRILSTSPMPPHTTIDNINNYPFKPDDVVIGFGTSYVRGNTIAKLDAGILNLHTGILPQYRGVKPEFWALHNHDYGNIGWTLHQMTTEIDGGPLVYQRWRRDYHGETAPELRAQMVQEAAITLRGFLDIPIHFPAPIKQHGGGKTYSTPTLHDWRRATNLQSSRAGQSY